MISFLRGCVLCPSASRAKGDTVHLNAGEASPSNTHAAHAEAQDAVPISACLPSLQDKLWHPSIESKKEGQPGSNDTLLSELLHTCMASNPATAAHEWGMPDPHQSARAPLRSATAAGLGAPPACRTLQRAATRLSGTGTGAVTEINSPPASGGAAANRHCPEATNIEANGPTERSARAGVRFFRSHLQASTRFGVQI